MRKVLLLLGVVLLSMQLLAQQRSVTGTVTDAQGKPIANASVIVKGTTIGTTTKSDGSFSITVPATAKVLVFSSVDLNSEEVAIGSKTLINTTLQVSDKAMQEVVITGYSRERRSQFTGAATILSAKAIEEIPVGAFDQALQGRVSGMLVNSGTGQPGSSANVLIRGVQSITGAGAQPLYILDGVPIPASDFQTLNPDDFESFTVLKDAGAAALYGARGGTGVIVITTKRGKVGATSITVRNQVGITKAPDFSRLNLMDTKEMLEYERRLGIAGLNPAVPGWKYSKDNPEYNTLQAGYTTLAQQQGRYDTMLDSIGKINTDFSDVFFRQGLSHTHEINVSGGSDKTKYYLSVGTFNQEGIDLGSALKRYTTRFNLDHTVDKLTIQWNNAVGYSQTNLSEGEALGNSARNPFQMTYRAKTYENPYKADGTPNYGTNTTLALKQVGNLLEGIQNSSLTQKQIKINTGLSVAYRVLPYLTLKNTFGVDVASDLWQRYIVPGSYIGTLQAIGTAYPGLDVEAYKLTTNLVNTSSIVYGQKFDKHEIEVGGYFEVVRTWQKAIGLTLYNLDPRVLFTGQAAGALPTNGNATYPQNSTSANSSAGIRSFFGTVKYTYNNRYTVTGNVRRDGTSRIFNDANKEITTWSAGATWNMMQENFMKTQTIFSDAKLRASYGIVPNIGSIGTQSYGILGTAAGNWVTVTNYAGTQVPAFGTNTYAGSVTGGIAPTTPGNPNLKIETIQKLNIGVDFAVWRNRARFAIDVYKNRTVNLFVSQPLSATTGFGGTSNNINAGIMTNKGIEFTGSVDFIQQKNVSVTLGLTHSININKIEDLGLVNEYPSGTFVIRKGLAYGSHFTPKYLGVDPTNGKPRFATLDGKEVNDVAAAPNFADFGTYLPKHVGGITLDIRVRRFSIGALFSYQFDVVRSNNIRNWITRGTSGYQVSVNGSKELLTRQWQKPGDNAYFPSPIYDKGFTSADLENAKFLRFRNLNVAYSLPSFKLGGMPVIKGGKVYVQMQNIAVWSPWTGLDPEDNNNISLNEYPNPTMIVAGIDINF